MAARSYLALGYAVAMTLGAAPNVLADDLASCAAIDDPSARLACYDRLAGRQVPPGVGKWHLDRRNSTLSGGEVVSLTLHAERPDPTDLPPWMQPQLIISCDNQVTQVLMAPQQRLSTSNQEMDVVLRIDGGEQVREVWHVSENSLIASRPDPLPWIKSLQHATRLEIGLRPFAGKLLDFTFNVEGLATAMLPLAKACDW